MGDKAMKILAILASPRKEKGNTYQIITRMIREISLQKVDIELVHLSDFKIGYCTGCSLCITEGSCSQKDDTGLIQDKILTSDGLIFASPTYLLQVSAQAKTFLDRCCFWTHRPPLLGKYFVSVVTTALTGEKEVLSYLKDIFRIFGAIPVGELGARIPSGEAFIEQEKVFNKAIELANDLIKAIEEKREYPPTQMDILRFKGFKNYISKYKDRLKADYEYWKAKGWLEAEFY
jgi:multimeric flavodoxin WrbA